ncbi:uncharacterized protein LOC123302855 [Chrysoperla carnea]|uniref:uncharacterized protein LOC123302855 n=1 Tax=Chrysoperla carnea TaxID=189513 RepID=UPI001D06B3C5|nr:uncharacterized protein LOC123302855 [Chrysoperla carnea]
MVPSNSSSNTLSLCSTTSTQNYPKSNSTILLGTALVYVLDKNGNQHTVRFLLDSASQCHFLTSTCCRRLNLSISNNSSTVQGIGNGVNLVKGEVHLVFSSRFNENYRYPIVALVVDRITDKLPHSFVDINTMPHLMNLPLADVNFHSPGEIDGIIGAELYSNILGNNRIMGLDNFPTALETTLGYVVMGKSPVLTNLNSFHSFCTTIEPPLEKLVEKFWSLEEIPSKPIHSPDDIHCETIFKATYKRQASGRYTVALPFRYSWLQLGDSYFVALRRFYALEKKFRQDPQYKIQYSQMIKEYLNEGYLKKLDRNTDVVESAYYIPHHGVIKLESESTPLRIVMDAGAKSNSSYSLNDLLYSGPKLQADVLTLFLKFRLFEIALTADIRRMYLQIDMAKDHRRFQRILWRDSEDDDLSVYELTTVTFGVKSSPFLALRIIQQLAEDEQTSYPLASKVARNNMYMDDLITSVHCLSEANELYREMIEFFKSGGFEIVKWATNSRQLLEIVPDSLRANNPKNFDSELMKILGLQWQPNSDMLSFNRSFEKVTCTKRNILSIVARIFDPCGFVAPVTLQLKLFIKELWTHKLDWDQTPPNSFVKRWEDFVIEMPLLKNFKIPRHLGVFTDSVPILVGFCDASESAYAALVYMRT